VPDRKWPAAAPHRYRRQVRPNNMSSTPCRSRCIGSCLGSPSTNAMLDCSRGAPVQPPRHFPVLSSPRAFDSLLPPRESSLPAHTIRGLCGRCQVTTRSTLTSTQSTTDPLTGGRDTASTTCPTA
jgi:hypothetical protein